MLSGASSSPKASLSPRFSSPFEGLSSSAQLTEKSRCGIIIGMIERMPNRNLNGMSVRVFR